RQPGRARTREGTDMSGVDGTFILVATYPNEAAARDDYQVVKELHARGVVGSYDAAVVTKDANGNVHENKDETATRHGAWWGIAAGGVIGGVSGHLARGMSRSDAKELGDFIDPGQAGLIVVGDSKLQAAIEKALAKAEKQTAKELGVDPKDVDKALQEAVADM